MSSNVFQAGVAITNPLVLYRSLLATNRIRPDPAQHRLALHLQKLYERLKDYEPEVEYGYLLEKISRTNVHVSDMKDGLRSRLWASLVEQKEKRDSLALTRTLTNHETALELNSPKGLMVHGEVGTGKSMLIDLFADCLPNKKKRRWHFNTFMLETFSKLESLRRARSVSSRSIYSVGHDDYSLLWLARDLIQTSPILFLDEFQLPDRAASKIMSNLMTSFFQLGGVLIATSNRMPEELAKASGIEFGPPASRLATLGWKIGLRRSSNASLHPAEFSTFLELLKSRCDIWEMSGVNDYRRSESGKPKVYESGETGSFIQAGCVTSESPATNIKEKDTNITMSCSSDEDEKKSSPNYYLIKPSSISSSLAYQNWSDSFDKLQQQSTNYQGDTVIPWKPSSIRVYGRNVTIPRQHNGVNLWTFKELCESRLGPADYISLASTFHTHIIIEIPVLTILKKNEARRFITLLDALYEARCKLLISAAAGPDDIFFPEKLITSASSTNNQGTGQVFESQLEHDHSDIVHSETFSEAYQDTVSPFRPNTSSYDKSQAFLDYNQAHQRGILSEDSLEDDPPSRLWRAGRASANDAQPTTREQVGGLDFRRTGSFTGEDERFAYKRAISRLWEMCGTKWWSRNEEGWWRPLPMEARRWEAQAEGMQQSQATSKVGAGEGIGIDTQVNKDEEHSFRHGSSPFRTHSEPPPKFHWAHMWGTIRWGKRAGAWGKGVEGLAERKRESKDSEDR